MHKFYITFPKGHEHRDGYFVIEATDHVHAEIDAKQAFDCRGFESVFHELDFNSWQFPNGEIQDI